MNREYFFNRIRDAVFGGKLAQSQVEGITRILDYRDSNYPKMSDDELAYLLATVTWETAFKMQPVREMGGERYLRSKKYYPWVGEGLVQVTWKENAVKFGAKKPGDLMTWPISLRAAFEGMIKGMFTGKKLADYIGGGRVDYVGARRIINGTDRAKLIAGYARSYQNAFKQASASVG
jgi:hypothetical protein